MARAQKQERKWPETMANNGQDPDCARLCGVDFILSAQVKQKQNPFLRSLLSFTSIKTMSLIDSSVYEKGYCSSSTT